MARLLTTLCVDFSSQVIAHVHDWFDWLGFDKDSIETMKVSFQDAWDRLYRGRQVDPEVAILDLDYIVPALCFFTNAFKRWGGPKYGVTVSVYEVPRTGIGMEFDLASLGTIYRGVLDRKTWEGDGI